MNSTSNNASFILNNTLNFEECIQKYEDFIITNTDIAYCNYTWDSILCWPPTPANTTARQNCPELKGIDITKYAERRCSVSGRWERKPGSTGVSTGWTNYTPCYSAETLKLMTKLFAGGSEDGEDVATAKLNIASKTRILEFIGLSLSLFTLIISLVIFRYFHNLRNNRTKIHKNLFVAMVIQVIIRLTLYLDQALTKQDAGQIQRAGIDNTPYLCEASYVLLEYARTAMFLWMFIEGLYLHNVLIVTVFQAKFPHAIYGLIGWGCPIIMTAIWAGFTFDYMHDQKCWYGYNFTPYYWILEGPRLGVIFLNFLFLLNIIRVLIVKLRQSHTSEVEQVRKAVRAAVVLLPLLGITNLLNMLAAPLDRSPLEFAFWSYITHFLTSFQGFFIAMLYCFLNGEVRATIMKSLRIFMSNHGYPDLFVKRHSYSSSAAYVTAAQAETIHYAEDDVRPETTLQTTDFIMLPQTQSEDNI